MKALLIKLFLFVTKSEELSLDDQEKMISSMPTPKDDMDRSYYNYLCCSSSTNSFSKVFLNVCGIAVIPAIFLVYLINLLLCNKKPCSGALFISCKNRIGMEYRYEDRFPNELKKEFKKIKTLKLDSFPGVLNGVIGFPVLKVWLPFVLRHPFAGYINFRALLNLANFYRLVYIYEPEAIINFRAELNSMSSIITLMCENEGVEYINFMHGEVMTNISSAFVRFSRFYIWDDHYKEVFRWSKSPMDQFRTYLPAMYDHKSDTDKSDKEYFITYMFCGDEKGHMDFNAETICRVFKQLDQKGYKCKVRPHPRWSDMNQLHKVFDGSGIEIEIPEKVSVTESIYSSEYIAGTFSSVLTEAYYMKKTVVIDDISDKELISTLKRRKYFLLNKEHILLSKLLEESSIDPEEV